MLKNSLSKSHYAANAMVYNQFKRSLSYLSSVRENGIATITLNSKPVNALTTGLMSELKRELENIHASSPNAANKGSPEVVKAVIFNSSLPKVFSAGLDLKTLVADPAASLRGDGSSSTDQEMAAYRDHIKTYMGLFSECVELLLTLPQPTVALVKGHAPAGGTVLSLCCDYRIGSETGFAMGLNEVQVGMAPPLWVHRLMLNAVGPRKSQLAVQKGQMYKAQECLSLGLVDAIVPDEDLLERANQEIGSYLTLPWIARVDAKLKSVENVTSCFNPAALDAVVDSISGPEFQVTVKAIIESLKKK